MKIFNSKRGSIIGFIMAPLFSVIFAAMVLVGLMLFISGIKENIVHEKRFISTDVSLLTDAVLSIKDNADLIYHPARKLADNKYTFDGNVSFVFKSNKIEVSTDRLDDPHRGIYLFAPRKDVKIPEKTFKFDKTLIVPRISKVGNTISITDVNKEKLTPNKHKLVCPDKKLSFPNIVVDAGHGVQVAGKVEESTIEDLFSESDSGYLVDLADKTNLHNFYHKSESMLTNNWASHLPCKMDKPCKIENSLIQFTRNVGFNDQVALKKDKRLSNALNSNLVVSLHIGNHPSDFPLKIFYPYNSEDSYAFACQLANSLSDKLILNNIQLSGVSLVPFNPDLLPVFDESHKDNPLEVVKQGNAGVLVELGSIKQFSLVFGNLHIYANALEEVIKNVQ